MKDFIVTFWDGTTAEVKGESPVDAGLKFKGKKHVFAVAEKINLGQPIEYSDSIFADDSKWCECDQPDYDNATYFDDGEHEELYKHHWRCSCNKILQIG